MVLRKQCWLWLTPAGAKQVRCRCYPRFKGGKSSPSIIAARSNYNLSPPCHNSRATRHLGSKLTDTIGQHLKAASCFHRSSPVW